VHKFNNSIYILLLAIISTCLHLYKFDEIISFHGELGHNYFAVRNFYESGVISLVGPPTSHQWLSFGPLFYWFISPILYFGRFDIYLPALVMTLVHISIVPIAFVFINKLFAFKNAIITATLLALSPVFIQFSRDARFFSLVLVIYWPFLYALINKHYFLTFFLFSIMINFHFTPLVLVPGIVSYLFLTKHNGNLKNNLIRAALGLFIPQIPYIVHIILNSPITLIKLLAWVPYRIAGFVGILPKNNLNSEVITANNQSIVGFFSSIVSPENNLAIAFFILIILIYYFLKLKGEVHRLIKLLFLTSLAAVYIHGDPPSHYYLPILPLLIIIVSSSLVKLNFKLLAALFAMLVIFNVNYYFGDDVRFKQGLIPYQRQVKVVREILQDARGASIHLQRVGPYDHFEDDYAQNYQYLAWLYGSKPVKADQAQVIYTIYEKDGDVTYQRNE